MKIKSLVLTKASVGFSIGRLVLLLSLCSSFLVPATGRANPFLPKAGEATTNVRVATCAVSGGFVHLYTAMDNGIFEKYAIKVDTNLSAAAP